MDEFEMLFSSIDEEEMEELIANVEDMQDTEISETIKNRLDISQNKKITKLPLRYILPVAAMLCVVIACSLAFTLNTNKVPTTVATTTEAKTSAVAPAPNPLMEAISTGDDALVENLLTLPGLVSQETLDFALNFSNLLSYETINRIALSVKETLGSTGLDGLLESSIFGDSKRALEELGKRDSMLMTPFEKLAFFFAVAFCDSEVVDEFINRGYDINITDSRGNSIYAIAEKYGNEENMQYAASKGITS